MQLQSNTVLTEPATGIVTLDADGQHDPQDARWVGDRLDEKPSTLVLGVRRFLGTVPLRSRIGNTFTRWLFRLLLGVWLTDTQTGLRQPHPARPGEAAAEAPLAPLQFRTLIVRR